MKRWIFALSGLLAGCGTATDETSENVGAFASALGEVYFGEVTDAVGDAQSHLGLTPDLVYGSALAEDGNMTLVARLAPETYENARVSFVLDTDRNPATGFPGVDSGFSDADVMSTDYLLAIPSGQFATRAKLSRYTGVGIELFVVVSSDLPITYGPDGPAVTFPLALLGDHDGRLHYKVTTQVEVTEFGTSGIRDYMPDVGLPPGSTLSPAQEVDELEDTVEALEPALGHGPTTALGNHLANALRQLERGNVSAAVAQLEAFIAQVEDLVADGTLSAAEAAPLLEVAERALAGIVD